jgi:hypothetical protein
VLKNEFFEILPIPKSRPNTIAIKKETIVAPKVIFIPGMINLKALRYSSPVIIVYTIQDMMKNKIKAQEFSALNIFLIIYNHHKTIGTDNRAY